jgi:hypothetical protein
MDNCAPISPAMELKLQLVKKLAEADPELRTKFQLIIEAFLYLSNMTRLDIFSTIVALSRHRPNLS